MLREYPCDLGLKNDFLNKPHMHKQNKTKNFFDYIKSKDFLFNNGPWDKGNKQVTDWEGKFAKSKTDGLISEMYKELEVNKMIRSATEIWAKERAESF